MSDTWFAQTADAASWAKAFVGQVRETPWIATHEATMIGWFANAIMRGHDDAMSKAKALACTSAGPPMCLCAHAKRSHAYTSARRRSGGADRRVEKHSSAGEGGPRR